MTTEELEQIRKIIREETVSKEELKASEERIKTELKQAIDTYVYATLKGFFLEFGDFGIVELFLLNLKRLLKQRYHLVIFA